MVAKQAARTVLTDVSHKVKAEFASQKNILSFEEYLDLLMRNPRRLCRHSAQYLKDMIDFFGVEDRVFGHGEHVRSFKVFERRSRRTKAPIVGQAAAHECIYGVLEQFVRQGRSDKLILLHGPNGSSKSSTADALAAGLEEYSREAEGAVYRFNWIFPTDKVGYDGLSDDDGRAKRIGFGTDKAVARNHSYAHLGDEEVLCKIISEMKENPFFLLPAERRREIFRKAVQQAEGKELQDDEIPRLVDEGALGSKSKRIFDALMAAYEGDLEKVLKHVQVERFFFSSRYRVGVATVEPQMHVDAQDRQLTLDKNVQNLPSVLQNIRIFEPSGELIDANRGFVEFSDLLKRPVEAYKYLLTTVENMSVNLASGIADLDLIFLASANEKHLDAFKSSPDWASFKGRFELVRVPYLLSSGLEQRIYETDVAIIERTRKIGPHVLDLLSRWAVLTRLKEPDVEEFPVDARSLLGRLSPVDKLALYDGRDPSDDFNEQDKTILKKLAPLVRREGQKSYAYEGRFGASPREIKMLLYFSAQNPKRDSVSALSIFQELEALMTDRSVYEYLQFEPSRGYHDVAGFLTHIKKEYATRFLREFRSALNLFDEEQYAKAFDRYLKQIVAYIKNEKIYNDITHRNEPPDETAMAEFEKLLGIPGDEKTIREYVMAKVASWRVEFKQEKLDIRKVFVDEFKNVERNIYQSRSEEIERLSSGFLVSGSEDYERLPVEVREGCEATYRSLQERFGYTRQNAWETFVFSRKILG